LIRLHSFQFREGRIRFKVVGLKKVLKKLLTCSAVRRVFITNAFEAGNTFFDLAKTHGRIRTLTSDWAARRGQNPQAGMPAALGRGPCRFAAFPLALKVLPAGTGQGRFGRGTDVPVRRGELYSRLTGERFVNAGSN
jgi:hypothetical protein